MRPAVRPLIVLSLLALMPLQSCLFGSSTQTSQEGRTVSDETLKRVIPGSSPNFVRGLLGEPTDIVKDEEKRPGKKPGETILVKKGEIWRYSYSKSTTSKGGVFLIFGSSSQSQEKGTVYVEFKEDQVLKTWRD